MRNGFSLVELSIVLVILGLLVGGVLTGQSLIRAAELRSVSTEFAKYQAAVNTFRDKYFQLPGDMNNATSFWGAAHATPATCLTTVGTGTQTCNGNGNGRIGPTGASGVALPDEEHERYRTWQQLANAGLIEGSYTWVNGPAAGTVDAIIGTNVPRAKLTQGGWTLVYVGTTSSHAAYYDSAYGNMFVFGGQHATDFTITAIIKPEEAWNIDTKLDDGRPSQGGVLSFKSSIAPGCATNDTSAAEYTLTSSNITCSMIFKGGF
jgi:prepilin-type N-terminal cleavage/methylation domain-containing protein